MKVDMTSPINDLDGTPLRDENKLPITLRFIVQQALANEIKADDQLTGPDKVRLFEMAMRANADSVDYTAEEIATIKARVGSMMKAVVVGRAYALLDPS